MTTQKKTQPNGTTTAVDAVTMAECRLLLDQDGHRNWTITAGNSIRHPVTVTDQDGRHALLIEHFPNSGKYHVYTPMAHIGVLAEAFPDEVIMPNTPDADSLPEGIADGLAWIRKMPERHRPIDNWPPR